MTTLSIAICAKDEQEYLPAQLEAIARQSVRPDEIVLLDDGSTDDTPSIMRAFAASHRSAVRVLTHERPAGAVAAFQRAVAACSGDFVWPLSANDILQPDAIRHIAGLAREHPDAAILAGCTTALDCDWADRSTRLGPEAFAGGLGQVGVLHGGSTVISRTAWDRLGGFLPGVGGWSDVWLWHATACREGAAICPYPLLEVRQHAGGVNQSLRTPEAREGALLAFARGVADLEEPTRTRLLASGLFDLPGLRDMRALVGGMLEGIA